MITWKNRNIDDLAPAELRRALEDAADEIVRARLSYGADQVWMTLFAGFVAGALASTLAMSGLRFLG